MGPAAANLNLKVGNAKLQTSPNRQPARPEMLQGGFGKRDFVGLCAKRMRHVPRVSTKWVSENRVVPFGGHQGSFLCWGLLGSSGPLLS